MSTVPAVVLDCGSCTTKVGLSGEPLPSAEFPTLIGRYKPGCYLLGHQRDYEIGDTALRRLGVLRLSRPVERGTVKDWDELEKVWHYAFFNELQVDSQEHGFLLTESPVAPIAHREKVAQVAFETFSVPRFYLCNQAELAVLSRGLTTALAIDSGEGRTVSVPVHNGYALPYGTMQINTGGSEVTEALIGLLSTRGLELSSSAEKVIMKSVKERFGYVSKDAEEEMKSVQSIEYELPDGTVITVNDERFLCTEVLFNPDCLKSSGRLPANTADRFPPSGIPLIAIKSLQRSEVTLRSRLYGSIVLAGGCSLFPNFSGRLVQDTRRYMPSAVELATVSAGKYGVWTGGSILASLEGLNSVWITKEEYEEWGPALVHKKKP